MELGTNVHVCSSRGMRAVSAAMVGLAADRPGFRGLRVLKQKLLDYSKSCGGTKGRICDKSPTTKRAISATLWRHRV